ncbi:MAG: O-antigen ligase family protein [Rubrobacteraceae bacterium]
MKEQVDPPGDDAVSRAPTQGDQREKSRRTGRLLAIFKAVILLTLAAVTAYGLLNHGLYGDPLWIPVANGILALLLVTVFVRDYYTDVPQAAWIMVAFLAALVAIKGISMAWSISETETIHEVVRSSMYLAVFVMALGALTSPRQVGPLMDVAILMVAAVAGYGLLQKINPVEYPIDSLDGVRIDSTLEYVNTTAAILGMGVALALARMTTVRNAFLRGIYAALTLAFLVALYLTASRGGIGSLGVGMIVLFVLTEKRVQTLGNLLLLSVPGAWLLWRIRDLEGFMNTYLSDKQRMVLGTTFRDDLVISLVAAFVLQAGFVLLANRYELTPYARRVLGALVVGVTVLAIGAGAFAAVNGSGGIGKTYETLVTNPNQTEDMGQRLASLDIGFRDDYWRVGWEAWKEHPLTGTGAGTFKYTWLQNRPNSQGVQQVHNLYLEQGTETGVFAFLALAGFVVTFVGYLVRAAWRSRGDRRLLLAGFTSALGVYLVSSFLEWHWYIPGSTLFFFFLAGITVKFACSEEWVAPEVEVLRADDGGSPDERPQP